MEQSSSAIKCPNCQTWNYDLDYCSNCNHLLNPAIHRQQEAEKRWQEYKNRPKDVFDLYFERIKTSDKVGDKIAYFFFRSAWFLLIAIVLVGLSIAAVGPG